VRPFLSILVALALLGALSGWGYWNARGDPVVRSAAVALPGWPRSAPPVRAILLSDVHVGHVTMDHGRLSRIVAQINALRPDLVLIAGDFASDKESARPDRLAASLAPLSGLHARLGVVATLGNHDHWADAALVRHALERVGVTVLENEAIRRGPLVIGGAGDAYTRHQDIAKLASAMDGLTGGRLILTHSPDIAPLLPSGVPLFAGHTHCGQIVLPLYGPLVEVAAPRYRCGLVREGDRTIIVTGGLGTSTVPMRFGAPPDLWVLTLGPTAPPVAN